MSTQDRSMSSSSSCSISESSRNAFLLERLDHDDIYFLCKQAAWNIKKKCSASANNGFLARTHTERSCYKIGLFNRLNFCGALCSLRRALRFLTARIWGRILPKVLFFGSYSSSPSSKLANTTLLGGEKGRTVKNVFSLAFWYILQGQIQLC